MICTASRKKTGVLNDVRKKLLIEESLEMNVVILLISRKKNLTLLKESNETKNERKICILTVRENELIKQGITSFSCYVKG